MKLKDNNYGKIEGVLFSVPQLKVEIENLKIDLEEISEVIGITGQSGNVAAGSATNAFNSNVENEAMDRILNLEDKQRKINASISKRERKLRKIENNLSLLSENEMLLVEFKYFKNYPNSRVCDVLAISERAMTKRKKNVIFKLMGMSW